MPLPKKNIYTIEDIYALPDGVRAELIDGAIYDMAPSNYTHQKLVSRLIYTINSYINNHGSTCEVLPSPFAVFLNGDDKTYVEPDISVICDKDKLTDKGCSGAPDWIIEIVSPSSQRMDYQIKLFKYRTAGVREYWIINPATRISMVYGFENDANSGQYRFDQPILAGIYDDLEIRIEDLLK